MLTVGNGEMVSAREGRAVMSEGSLLEDIVALAAQMVCLGDKLSNIRSINRDFEELGDTLL